MGVSIGPYCKLPFLQCYWKFVALVRVAVTVADRDSEVNQKISAKKNERQVATARFSFWLVFGLAFARWWLHQTAKTASESTGSCSESRAMTAQRLTTGARSAVVSLDVVSFSAVGVVVISGFTLSGGVPRICDHLTFPVRGTKVFSPESTENVSAG